MGGPEREEGAWGMVQGQMRRKLMGLLGHYKAFVRYWRKRWSQWVLGAETWYTYTYII